MSTPIQLLAYALIILLFVLALRLARGALRTRAAADALVAAFFFGASLGYLGLLARRTFADPGGPVYLGLSIAGETLLVIPTLAMALFTWIVFRRSSQGARLVAFAIVAVMVIGRMGIANARHFATLPFDTGPGSVFSWTLIALAGGTYAWAGVEAMLYYLKSRRRAAIGLADPVVSNRFLLWAIWSGCSAAVLVVRVAGSFAYDASDPTASLPVLFSLGQMLFGLGCFLAIGLTFSPPEAYLRFVRGRVEATS